MANVIMLPTISRKTVPISRRMMNVATARAGARLGCYSRRAPAPSPTFFARYGHISEVSRSAARHAFHGVVVELVGLVEIDVGQRRRAVDQWLRVHDRHDDRVVHDLLVDLAPDLVPLGRVGDALGLGEQVVHLRVVEHPDVGVTGRDDGRPADPLAGEAGSARTASTPTPRES